MIAKIAGEEFELRYRLKDVAAAEDEMGMNVQTALRGVTLRQLGVLLSAGIKHKHRSYSTAKALDLLDKHLEGGGSIERQVFAPVAITLAESGFLGDDTDPELLRKNLLGEGGKDQSGTPQS